MDVTELKGMFLLGASLSIVFSMGFGAFKFFQKGNWILSAEWAVMFTSTSSLTVWIFTQWNWQYNFVMYLDAFSRVAGMNLLVVFGFLAVTHQYKPSLKADVLIFITIGMIAAALMYVEPLNAIRPYVFFAVHYMFLPFLLLLVYKLFQLGEHRLGRHMLIASVLLTYIHSIADFYPIPGDETNIVYNYGFMALTTWAYAYAVIFFAYEALEKASKPQEA